MTRLRETIPVQCSTDVTQARIESYFTSLRGANGVAHLRLRVPVDFDDRKLGLSVDREVRVEVKRTRDDDNLNDVLRIGWNPEGRTILPVFQGTLVVWGEDDPRQSYIELNGTYTPPLGETGKAFDAVIGHRIASSTARELLRDLKRAVESPRSHVF